MGGGDRLGLRIAMNESRLNLDSSAGKKGALIKLPAAIFRRKMLGFEVSFKEERRGRPISMRLF